MTKGNGMDKGPESPGTAQRRPLRGLNVLPDLLGRFARERANDQTVGGIQKNGPHGQVGRDFNARGPPGPTKIQIVFHRQQPIMTEGTVTNESGGGRPKTPGQIQLFQFFALQDLTEKVAEAVRDTAGASCVIV